MAPRPESAGRKCVFPREGRSTGHQTHGSYLPLEASPAAFVIRQARGHQAESLAETIRKGSEVQLSGSLLQKKFKTVGSQARTFSKVEIRVQTIAPLLIVAKLAGAQQPAEEPQPA